MLEGKGEMEFVFVMDTTNEMKMISLPRTRLVGCLFL